ncbi:MAG: pyridoxamine 5'-phosphate oxidase family protein [Alphaproteobacteria bacterium]|nr:pyridoxamine 5'-phosphate oxidase family protein [Alphaproteobacteria bacterium]
MPQQPAKKDILQPVDDDARRLAKTLIRSARHAALGTLDPADGAPAVSRVNVATTIDGRPLFLISRLSAHFQALETDPRVSLLIGEPGKGDPMAHARMTLIGRASRLSDEGELQSARQRFLMRHPKSQIYVDFPDFAFWCLEPLRISLNGGFARAFALQPHDLLTSMEGLQNLAALEPDVVAHMNSDHSDAVDGYAHSAGQQGTGWKLASLDPEGIDLCRGDDSARIWFEAPLAAASELRQKLIDLVRR